MGASSAASLPKLARERKAGARRPTKAGFQPKEAFMKTLFAAVLAVAVSSAFAQDKMDKMEKKDPMKKDAMKKDSMAKKDAMKKDGMMKKDEMMKK
jgi:pentapeptide MXKDX repeat protein